MVENWLLRHRAAVEFTVAPVDDQADAIVARDDCLKREPPQFAEAIWKAGRHVNRKWHTCLFQDGIAEAQHVAIGVIESQANKPPRKIPFSHPVVHLIEADQIQA